MANDSLVPSKWAALRDAAAAIRELMVIAAVTAVFVMPQKVQQFLTQAGIRSVAGVEFDWQKFNDAQSELRLAQSDLREIQDQLELANQTILGSEPTLLSAAQVQPLTGRLLESAAGARGSTSPTVDVPQLQRALQDARTRGQHAEQRLQRADRLSRQAIPEQILASPETLFGHRAAGPAAAVGPR